MTDWNELIADVVAGHIQVLFENPLQLVPLARDGKLKVLGMSPDPKTGELVQRSVGTGVVIVDKGIILTNLHVVWGATRLKVTFADGTESEAKVVATQPNNDLAVLKPQKIPDDLQPATLGSSRQVVLGDAVAVIGFPFGMGPSASAGVVSGLNREFTNSKGDLVLTGLIQFDAAANPGNSGGPLLDSSGRLIGVNTQIVSPSGAYAGIGFAVPVDTVNRIVPELIKHGKLIRPGLGVSLVPDSIVKRWGIKGLVIGKVARGGSADRAGLRGARETQAGRIELGDIVVAIDGKPVETIDDMMDVMEAHKVGDQVTLEIIRANKRQQLSLTLQAVN